MTTDITLRPGPVYTHGPRMSLHLNRFISSQSECHSYVTITLREDDKSLGEIPVDEMQLAEAALSMLTQKEREELLGKLSSKP